MIVGSSLAMILNGMLWLEESGLSAGLLTSYGQYSHKQSTWSAP